MDINNIGILVIIKSFLLCASFQQSCCGALCFIFTLCIINPTYFLYFFSFDSPIQSTFVNNITLYKSMSYLTSTWLYKNNTCIRYCNNAVSSILVYISYNLPLSTLMGFSLFYNLPLSTLMGFLCFTTFHCQL